MLSVSGSVAAMLKAVMSSVPVDKIAVHFHDTYGQALANILDYLGVKREAVAANFLHYTVVMSLHILVK
jgi:hydroxymethylglutaryl-CoA lyase